MDAVNVTTTTCRDCGAQLRPTDKTCDRCGGTAVNQAGTNQATTDSKAKLQQLLDRPWVIVVLMLHVGLLGIPVYWNTNYSLGARLSMVIASIVYTLGAVAFIVVMLRWLMHMTTGG